MKVKTQTHSERFFQVKRLKPDDISSIIERCPSSCSCWSQEIVALNLYKGVPRTQKEGLFGTPSVNP